MLPVINGAEIAYRDLNVQLQFIDLIRIPGVLHCHEPSPFVAS